METDILSDDDLASVPLDRHSIEIDITRGARAYQKLLNHAADDWTSWSVVILGFRGLRSLAFEKSGTSDIHSWHYRQALKNLLTLKRYAIYDLIGKQTRSSCYALMDHLDEIDAWYSTQPTDNKMRWKHPDTIVKHAPRHLVAGGKGSNQPKKPATKKKPLPTAEVERLRQILITVIKRLAKHEPDAIELLDEVMPESDLNDEVPD